MTIVLIRHGETKWSRDKRHTSRTDLPLTEGGREQAARIPVRSFQLVLASPRRRARETADIAGLGYEIDEDLVEWDYGEYEGRTTADIRQERPGWEIWRDGCPGGEPIAQVAARVDRVIERIARPEADVAVVAHGHLLRILGARWIGQPPEVGGALKLDTAAVCELGYERERRVIVSWNSR